MSEIAEFINAGFAAQTAADAAIESRREPVPPKGSENVPIVLSLSDDVIEMISTMRTLLRSGCLPVSTVQSVKLQCALEQMGRCAFALADDLRKFHGRPA